MEDPYAMDIITEMANEGRARLRPRGKLSKNQS